MHRLSYIIPYYNGGDILKRMLDSIYKIGLSKDELEVIVVDDCSPEPVVNILEGFAGNYPDIKIIRHKHNERQGGAKNTGILNSTGRYVAFADQDDVVCSSNIVGSISVAEQYDVDMLACNYMDGALDKLLEKGLHVKQENVMNGKVFCEKYFRADVSTAPWAYLYKREFLLKQNHPFPTKVLYEDADWVIWHMYRTKRILYYDKPIYAWVTNMQSLTHSHSWHHGADRVISIVRKLKVAEEIKNESEVFYKLLLFDARNNMIAIFQRLWKHNKYFKLYRHIGDDNLEYIKKYDWPKWMICMLKYPNLTCTILTISGPILKIARKLR